MRRPRGSAVEKRPGVWQLRASMPKDAAGKVRKACKAFRSSSPKPRGGGLPKDVERALAAWVRECEEARVPVERYTYADLVQEWFKVADLEEQTRYGYEGYLRRYILPEFGQCQVSAITVQQLDHFYADMRKRGFGAGTIRQCHAILRRSLAMAAKWGWVPYNPAAMTSPELKRMDGQQVEAPSPEEVAAWLEGIEARDPYLALYVRLSAALGSRRGETLGLRWEDIDFAESTVRVERAIFCLPGQPIKAKGTKTGATGVLAIPRALSAALRIRRGFRHETEYVFTDDPAGRIPWRPDSVTHRATRIRDQLGLPKRLTLRNMRHFHATQLLARGTDLGTVAARLRHADKATTMRFYSKKDEAADRRAADVWEDVL